MKRGPDFLCIGMQKAGTRTLYDLLSLDPRFWMPLIKEFHHYSPSRVPYETRHKKILDILPALREAGALRKKNLRRSVEGQRPLSDVDLRFIEKYKSYLGSGRSDDDYLDLFSVCPKNLKTGDITPAYSALDEARIARIHRQLPEARILLLIRDPVSRAWSHANKMLRRRHSNSSADFESALSMMEGAARTDDFLDILVRRPALIGKGHPASIYRNWAAFFGDKVEVFSFEEICGSQKLVADRIAALFGVPPSKTGGDGGQVVENRKSAQAKVRLGERERDFLVDHFRDELFECRELFGEEKTRGWLEKYGLA